VAFASDCRDRRWWLIHQSYEHSCYRRPAEPVASAHMPRPWRLDELTAMLAEGS